MIDRSLPVPKPARGFLLALRGVGGNWTTQIYKSEAGARRGALSFFEGVDHLEQLEAWIIYLHEEGRVQVKRPEPRARLRLVR